MKRIYYAYVAKNMTEHFEKRVNDLQDKIKIIRKTPVFSEKGELIFYYVLAAEEGYVNPKWKLEKGTLSV